ncbi:hypothetical protein [Nocardiopsis lambiniae]|uniref:Lipoprotein n=1 Tax=Nocardiopsis lambiniae TaxID=3075539 RepID=A0ABU2MC77_9ACTN|nr:hypothetical protein [Nocardiopsis sp. DSM 44743]MDT0330160.1 hypothetical protein [Nocardiopsis sp. DSM 44743]
MRKLPFLPLALVPLAVGCASGGTQTVAFGESAAVPRPVGAYESEFIPGRTADVLYSVDEVVSPSPGTVTFTLTVEIPELGRTSGLRNLTAVCESGGHHGPARSEEQLGEADGGTHPFAMVCAVPEDAEELLIAVEHYDHRMEFTGTPG